VAAKTILQRTLFTPNAGQSIPVSDPALGPGLKNGRITIGQLMALLSQPDLTAASYMAFVLSLPTSPPATLGMWNNNGVPTLGVAPASTGAPSMNFSKAANSQYLPFFL
jgi:hypothetical protein